MLLDHAADLDALTGGTTYFSRNGSLSVDSQRYLVDSNGGYLQVLPVDAEGNTTASGIAASRNIQLPLTSGTPRATSRTSASVTSSTSATCCGSWSTSNTSATT